MADPFLVNRDGWWWPLDDADAHPVILADYAPSIALLLPHVTGRALIVQAGANVGIYPVALADHFRQVLTAEPDPTNHACLVKNLSARDSLGRVTEYAGAFGEMVGICAPLEVQPRNCGAHRVSFGRGPIPVITIDLLLAASGADACDCIWLDVEGAELPALKGAVDTIERFSPTIAVEDKGLHRAFDIPDGALQAWLAERGYTQVDKIGRDKVFRRIP